MYVSHFNINGKITSVSASEKCDWYGIGNWKATWVLESLLIIKFWCKVDQLRIGSYGYLPVSKSKKIDSKYLKKKVQSNQ